MADPPSKKKYGVTLYSVSWIPQHIIKSWQTKTADDSSAADHTSEQPATEAEAQTPTEGPAAGSYLVFAGGGGKGNHGISNAVLLAHFDAASNSLSDQPVGMLGTGSELPYRMTLHPNGDGLVCAMMTNSCRWFDWDQNQSSEIHKLGLKLSEKVLTQLEDVGQQLALAFNNDGTALAVGGEDRIVRVFKWPSMEIILNESNGHYDVKDLHFSSDGKLLVSLGKAGPYRVWNISSRKQTGPNIKPDKDEEFSFCRFSQINDKSQVLYIAANKKDDKGGRKDGSILTWNTQTRERMSSKHISRDAISALNVSADGKFLACGTTSGDVVIVNSANMQIQTMVKNAHLGVVTALAFSPDSRALASVSLDSSARVTIIEEKMKDGGFSLWIVVFIVLLAVAAYFLKAEGIVK